MRAFESVAKALIVHGTGGRLELNQQSESSKSRVLREQIAKLREGLAEKTLALALRLTARLGLTTERMARELLDERKTKELRVLESAVLIELNKEKSQRKESEALRSEPEPFSRRSSDPALGWIRLARPGSEK